MEYELLIKSFLAEQFLSFGGKGTGEKRPRIYHRKRHLGKSGHWHEIDLSFELTIGSMALCILVECKCQRRPVGVEVVLAFAHRLVDIGAHKGILVSSAGFQKGAITVAKAHKIALAVASGRVWVSVLHEHNPYSFAWEAILEPVSFFLNALRLNPRTQRLWRLFSMSQYSTSRIGTYKADFLPVNPKIAGVFKPLSQLTGPSFDELKGRLQKDAPSFDWQAFPPIAFTVLTDDEEPSLSPLIFGPGNLLRAFACGLS